MGELRAGYEYSEGGCRDTAKLFLAMPDRNKRQTGLGRLRLDVGKALAAPGQRPPERAHPPSLGVSGHG